MSKRGLNWIKAASVTGLFLGSLLLLQAGLTYHHVTGHLIHDHQSASAQEVKDLILREVKGFVGKEAFPDDLTLLVFRVKNG